MPACVALGAHQAAEEPVIHSGPVFYAAWAGVSSSPKLCVGAFLCTFSACVSACFQCGVVFVLH